MPQAQTIGKLFQESCRRRADHPALLIPQKGGPRTILYRELYELAFQYACVLQDLGLQRGDRINVFSENCYEWALLDWACQTTGIALVPIYPTLPADQVAYIVQDSGAKLLVAGSPELEAKVASSLSVPIHQLISGDASISARAATATGDRAEWEAGIDAIGADDMATIIYTSGTTGDPKGATLLHKNIAGITTQVKESLDVNENDTFLSFLPLSHVYERVDGHILPIVTGATIAYAGSLASLAQDMVWARPTIMCCVPRFLEAMKERILDGMKKAPPLRQKLFHACLSQGINKLRGKPAPLYPILDKLVASKVRERTGGRLKFFVSGGMAMPMHVYEFFGAFGLRIQQGYGLTETSSGVVFNPVEDNKPHTVGIPVPGVEVKLAQDGEILIRGLCVMAGYHNNPEATAAAIDGEGWFHTGDVGTWEGKHLMITDRKKDILVLGNGKNVAPQRIEDKLRGRPTISEAILFGDSQNYVGGLIVPNLDHIQSKLQGLGIKVPEPEKLLEHEQVRAMIKADIDATNKELADFEKVKKWKLILAQFSVETGELTPSLKVKRKVIRERYAAEIAGLFD